MKINQLNEGTKVTIESLKDNMKVSLDSTVCRISDPKDLKYLALLRNRYPDKDFCFLNPIHSKHFLVNFATDSVVKNIVMIRNQSPFAWENVQILNTNLPTLGRVHMVVSSRQELPHNRRACPRVRITQPGDFVFSKDDRKFRKDVTVNDISASGIGVIVKSSASIYEHMPCTIMFKDGGRFKLNAHVRRIQPLSEDRVLIGCAFDVPSDDIGRYVLQKQKAARKHA